jgi:hypothetical protein
MASATLLRRATATGWLALGLLGAHPATAGDGVIEINQTCAVDTGCMAGDAPGFPVDLTWRGSYRLTGSLISSLNDQPVIRIIEAYITLDLNGFGVHQAGPSDPQGGGIVGRRHSTVKNGFVTHATNDGIRLGPNSRVFDVEVFNNDRDGVNVAGESVVRDVVATENGANGITAGFGSTVDGCSSSYNGGAGVYLNSGTLTRSTSTQNLGTGATLSPESTYALNYLMGNQSGDIVGGHPSAGNTCADGSCTSDGRRRFYLTGNAVLGGAATSACIPGFHMASLWELRDPSNLAFAHYLNYSVNTGIVDLGQGPPSGFGTGAGGGDQSLSGWIRTGYFTGGGGAGNANCAGWTNSTSASNGSLAMLDTNWADPGLTDQSPWVSVAHACNLTFKVWCVED